MEVNDRIRIYNLKDDSYETGTLVEIYEESYKIKHDKIGGHFILSKKFVVKE